MEETEVMEFKYYDEATTFVSAHSCAYCWGDLIVLASDTKDSFVIKCRQLCAERSERPDAFTTKRSVEIRRQESEEMYLESLHDLKAAGISFVQPKARSEKEIMADLGL